MTGKVAFRLILATAMTARAPCLAYWLLPRKMKPRIRTPFQRRIEKEMRSIFSFKLDMVNRIRSDYAFYAGSSWNA